MASKPKTTDLLTAWDETVVTVHMSVGKFRKMDEVYRENRELVKKIEDLSKELAKVQDQLNQSQNPDDSIETPSEMTHFLCEGILAALDAENGIVIKDPATALCLLTEAKGWLAENQPEQP